MTREEKIYKDDDTCLRWSDTDTPFSMYTSSLNSKFISVLKPVEAKELFGEMIYLSKEGQEEYTSVLDIIFRDTGINLL